MGGLPARLLRAATCSACEPSRSPATRWRSPPLDGATCCTRCSTASTRGDRRPAAAARRATAGPTSTAARLAELFDRDRRPLRALRPHRARRRTGRSTANGSRSELLGLVRPRLAARRRTGGATVIASEQRFGTDGDVTLALPAADSSPSTAASTASTARATGLVVTDHKTGSRPDVQATSPTPIPPSGGTCSSCRPTPPRRRARGRARTAPGARVGPRRVLVLPQGRLPADRLRVRRRGVGNRSPPTSHHVVSGIEAGWFPATRDQAAVPVPHRLPVLRTRLARHRRALAEWERKRHDPRLAPWFADDEDSDVTSRTHCVRSAGHRSLAPPPDQRRPRTASERPTSTDQPVRRGRRRRRQDDRARRPHRRARPTRRRRSRRSPPSRSPRRPPPSCATGCAARSQAAADGRPTSDRAALRRRPRRARPRPDRHAARLRPAAALRVPHRGRAAARLRRARRARERPRVRRAVGGPARTAARRSRIPPAGAIDGGVELVQLCEFDEFGLHTAFRRVADGLPGQLGPRRRPRRRSPPPPWSARHRAARARWSTPRCDVDTPARRHAGRACSPSSRELARTLRRRATIDRAASTRSARIARALSRKAERIGNKAKWKAARRRAALDDAARRASATSATRPTRLLGSVATLPRVRWSARSSGASCSTGRAAGGRRHARVPRPAGARPAAARHPTRRPRRCCTSATSGSCSTSSRTPTRSSSRSPCGSRPPRRPGPRHRLATLAPAARPAVHRRRPEAVDLPVPARRHRPVPRAPPTRSAPTRAAADAPTSARRRPVIDWVNDVFGRADRRAEPDVQPAYQPLDACRPRHRDHGTVHVLGADAHDDLGRRTRRRRGRCAGARRPRAADAVATALARAAGRSSDERHGRAARRAGPATSPSCCRPARRCRRSRRRSSSAASPTGPRTARSSTPPPRSAT